MRKLLAAVTAASLMTGIFAFPVFAEEKSEDIVILYTNDIHSEIDSGVGYDGLALYKREIEDKHRYVILADAGDTLQGGNAGTLTKGAGITELMNHVGCDAAVPGNHDFDYSVETLQQRGNELSCGYICCNFISSVTGEPVFEPYKILELGDTKIAFVGAVTPETFFQSTPVFFKNDEGEFIYNFCQAKGALYDVIQKNVDKARDEGADRVILLAHLGEENVTEEWSSVSVAANTTGIDAHSHTFDPGTAVRNKDGEEVIITSTGKKFNSIGQMTISEDGIRTGLITEVPKPDDSMDFDPQSWMQAEDREGRYVDTDTNRKIQELRSDLDSILAKKVGYSDFGLYVYDPSTGERIVRNNNSNIADLCTDAVRIGCGADVSILNAGSIKKDIKAGDITFGDLLDVYPYGNKICAAWMTGQTLLDILEFGASAYPKEQGGFIVVSGLEYTIDESIPSSAVVNESGEYVGVNGEYRVRDVTVGGEPLDLDRKYKVASSSYILQNGGDGYVLADKCDIYYESSELDVEQLEKFISDDLGGVIPEEYKEVYGQGRIRFVYDNEDDESLSDEGALPPEEISGEDSSENESSPAEDSAPPADSRGSDTNPGTGIETTAAILLAVALGAAYAVCRKKD